MIQIKQALLSIPGAALCEQARLKISAWDKPPELKEVEEVVEMIRNNHVGLSATLAMAILDEVKTGL